MKKLVLLLTLMFALQAAMMAQQTTGNITFNAHLQQTFNLIIYAGDIQEINFIDADDYNNGVTAGVGNGIVSGISGIQVEATQDWELSIECPDFIGTDLGDGHTVGGGSIPIDNLGYVISENGDHTNTDDVIYTTGLIMLTNAPADLFLNGPNGDAGDITDNDFSLTWEMGTPAMQALNGRGSMFDQMANGDFTTGDFQAVALLTLTPAP